MRDFVYLSWEHVLVLVGAFLLKSFHEIVKCFSDVHADETTITGVKKPAATAVIGYRR